MVPLSELSAPRTIGLKSMERSNARKGPVRRTAAKRVAAGVAGLGVGAMGRRDAHLAAALRNASMEALVEEQPAEDPLARDSEHCWWRALM